MTHSLRLSIYLDFYRFHRFISEDTSVPPKTKIDYMQAVNLLTTELQLRVEGSNNYHFFNKIFLKKPEKYYLFFKTRFKILF